MSTFKAYLTTQEGKISKTELVDFSVDQLDAGEVLINVDYSTVNYKDALSATGAGRIIRRSLWHRRRRRARVGCGGWSTSLGAPRSVVASYRRAAGAASFTKRKRSTVCSSFTRAPRIGGTS